MELQSGANPVGMQVRREGGGRKRAIVLQLELPATLEALIEDAIRGDPETPRAGSDAASAGSPGHWASAASR